MNTKSVARGTMYAATLLLSALLLPIAAGAQQAPAMESRASAGTLAARIEQRLSRLHTELGITQDEEAPWSQYAQVVRANARAISRLFAQRRAGLATMTATDNMQSMTDIAAQHAQNMQRMNTAFATLYRTMPPDQKRAADTVLRTRSMRRHQ